MYFHHIHQADAVDKLHCTQSVIWRPCSSGDLVMKADLSLQAAEHTPVCSSAGPRCDKLCES